MRALTAACVVWAAFAAPVLAQPRDRALERITLALQQPQPFVGGLDLGRFEAPKTFGIFTVVPPELRGEMIRVSVPIGSLVSQAFKGVAAAKRKRQEAAARRQVEADLRRFHAQQPTPRP